MAPMKNPLLVLLLLAGAGGASWTGAAMPQATNDSSGTPVVNDEITEIIIRAPEPRYVAPTRRDQIGRIWAPVMINGKGPFRLVLDTGASRSSVTLPVVEQLGLKPDESAQVRLRSVTGSATVPTIRVDTLEVGDLLINDSKLPVSDALGGAEGVLGNEGLADRRVYIDFRHDLIIISRSHGRAAPAGFMTIPFQLEQGRLLIANVRLGAVQAKAIIDTGAEVTVGNNALRNELARHSRREHTTIDTIEGVTHDTQTGEGRKAPPIQFGPIEIQTSHMTFLDTRIFEYWKMTKEPAVQIGMDALGLLDTLVIDYRRRELQLRMREAS